MLGQAGDTGKLTVTCESIIRVEGIVNGNGAGFDVADEFYGSGAGGGKEYISSFRIIGGIFAVKVGTGAGVGSPAGGGIGQKGKRFIICLLFPNRRIAGPRENGCRVLIVHIHQHLRRFDVGESIQIPAALATAFPQLRACFIGVKAYSLTRSIFFHEKLHQSIRGIGGGGQQQRLHIAVIIRREAVASEGGRALPAAQADIGNLALFGLTVFILFFRFGKPKGFNHGGIQRLLRGRIHHHDRRIMVVKERSKISCLGIGIFQRRNSFAVQIGKAVVIRQIPACSHGKVATLIGPVIIEIHTHVK